MREAERPATQAQPFGLSERSAGQNERRPVASRWQHFNLARPDTGTVGISQKRQPSTQGFGSGFLRSKSSRQRGYFSLAIRQLLRRVDAIQEPLAKTP